MHGSGVDVHCHPTPRRLATATPAALAPLPTAIQPCGEEICKLKECIQIAAPPSGRGEGAAASARPPRPIQTAPTPLPADMPTAARHPKPAAKEEATLRIRGGRPGPGLPNHLPHRHTNTSALRLSVFTLLLLATSDRVRLSRLGRSECSGGGKSEGVLIVVCSKGIIISDTTNPITAHWTEHGAMKRNTRGTDTWRLGRGNLAA